MGRFRKFVHRFSLPLFVLIAYTWSWSAWLLVAGITDTHSDALAGADSILTVAAIPLIVRVAFAIAALSATFGPAISAVILTSIADGIPGVREFSRRIVRVRFKLWFYLAVTLLPLALHLLQYAVALVWGADPPSFSPVAVLSAVGVFVAQLLRSGGQEELGFRGFFQHRMRERVGAIPTSVVVGTLWFFWHLPLYVWISSATQFGRSLIVGLVTQIAVTFLFTWVYDRTKSILLAMILHASINTAGILLGAGIPHPSGQLISSLTRIVSYTLIGVGLIAYSRSRGIGAGSIQSAA
jgi:membrane protease YdiL (CAAX protease family)